MRPACRCPRPASLTACATLSGIAGSFRASTAVEPAATTAPSAGSLIAGRTHDTALQTDTCTGATDPEGEVGRRGSVAGPLAEPRSERRPHVMANLGRWLVPTHPSGLIEAPHQVHIFAEPHAGIEAATCAECSSSTDERRSGNVRDPRRRPYPPADRPEIQRPAQRLEPGEQHRNRWCPGLRRTGTNAGGHEGYGLRSEAGQQRVQPAPVHLGVGVEERDERRGDHVEAGLPRGARPAVRAES